MEAFIFRTEHQLLEGGKPCLCVFCIISCLSGYLSFVILLQVVPSVAIGFTVYDLMKAYLRVPSRDDVIEEVSNKRTSQSYNVD